MKYPNGKKYVKSNEVKAEKGHRSLLSAANRGMSLEEDINLSNEYYRDMGIALITKRPTPINIVKVDYSKGARITDAYFEKQSTTDRFPLSFHPRQAQRHRRGHRARQVPV